MAYFYEFDPNAGLPEVEHSCGHSIGQFSLLTFPLLWLTGYQVKGSLHLHTRTTEDLPRQRSLQLSSYPQPLHLLLLVFYFLVIYST